MLTVPPPGGVPFPTTPHPLFNREGPDLYAAALANNAPFAKPGPYQTRLPSAKESAFRAWVKQQRIPFDPNAKVTDYDMRAYFLATAGKPHPQGAHFPDTFKTPYDTTFSAESRYAKAGTPFVWVGNTLVDSRDGRAIFGGH